MKCVDYIPSLKLTWHLQIRFPKKESAFPTTIFQGLWWLRYVSFRERVAPVLQEMFDSRPRWQLQHLHLFLVSRVDRPWKWGVKRKFGSITKVVSPCFSHIYIYIYMIINMKYVDWWWWWCFFMKTNVQEYLRLLGERSTCGKPSMDLFSRGLQSSSNKS